MRWLVDLPVSMTAIDAQQTFAAEARTTAMGRQHHFMPSDSGLSAPLRLACSHGLLLAQNQTLGIDSSGVHDDCYRAETGSPGRMRTSENAAQQTPAGKSQVVLLCELVMVFGLEVNTHRTTLTEKFTRRTR